MRAYSTKEKLRITAGAVSALVIVGWLAVAVLTLRRHRESPSEPSGGELCSCPENYGEGRATGPCTLGSASGARARVALELRSYPGKERFENRTTKKPAPGLVRTGFLGLKFQIF